jgi:hypothetical protein
MPNDSPAHASGHICDPAADHRARREGPRRHRPGAVGHMQDRDVLHPAAARCKHTQTLILAPTCELVQQIQKVDIALGDYMMRKDMAKIPTAQQPYPPWPCSSSILSSSALFYDSTSFISPNATLQHPMSIELGLGQKVHASLLGTP